MLVIAATGHHWWLDGVVALVLLWVSLQLDTLGRRAVGAVRLASTREAVAPTPLDELQPAFVEGDMT
jgi:hypothetical protein